MTSARERVTDHLARQAKRFPELDLNVTMDLDGLDPRDATLARAIDHAVTRRWLTLGTVLQHALKRPWETVEPAVQAALLVGAAQLLLFDRLPAHAVINEAVEGAKRSAAPKAGALVNAVLRKVAALRLEIVQQRFGEPYARAPTLAPHACHEMPLSDGRTWRLTEPVFDPDPVLRLAQQTSHMRATISQWVETFGEDGATSIALHSLVHPPIIVSGIDAAEAEAPIDAGRAADRVSAAEGASAAVSAPAGPVTAHTQPGFFVFEAERRALGAFLAEHPSARVQDPTAALPVQATAGLEPGVIIDYCAGKGTKTRQLATTHPAARIIASDRDADRRAVLREALAGAEQVQVVEPEELAACHGKADLLVLDVPCSNSGVLARRVEAKYRLSRASVDGLAGVQRQIIADAFPLLAPAGRLLYSTCSLDPAENERQAAWMARWHRMRIESSRLQQPRGAPGESPETYCDGGFFAILCTGPA